MVSSPSVGGGWWGPRLTSTNEPVPYVFLVIPGSWHACPKSAACWSPAIPLTGTRSPAARSGSEIAKRPLLGSTSARHERGIRNRSSSSSDHASRSMSNSMVRLAFDGSVTCTCARFHISQESTVPNASESLIATPPSASIHSSLVAEKYGSSTRPVSDRTRGSWPFARSSSQRDAVRRSCQTIARCNGRPVARSHTTVSRWLVMPMAAIDSPSSVATMSRMVADTADQISSGSCSTQPGRGSAE